MEPKMRGRLALESGAVFEGWLFGAPIGNAAQGEVVFNTCMTGYQEILTDPSYAGQMIVMTHPLMGNYGIHEGHSESDRIHCRALIVRELSQIVGHAQAQRSLHEELCRWNVPGISGVDTRALTRHLRDHGTLRGILAPLHAMNAQQQIELAKTSSWVSDEDLVAHVSQSVRQRHWQEPLGDELLAAAALRHKSPEFSGTRVVVVDMGMKLNQLRALHSRGADVIVVPHDVSFEELMGHEPQGVMLSNGPGDPVRLQPQVDLTAKLLEKRIPLLGICLGHQVLGRAIGAETGRLPFGHHGGNHPVRDEQNHHVYVTSQNHEFQVLADSIPDDSGWFVSERNLNDMSVEGLRHKELPAFSVQYHPEGAPGPQDRAEVFDEFLYMARQGRSYRAPEISSVSVEIKGHSGGRLNTVLVIGSGPVVIGQAAEFDYAGTQACRALREEGIRVILVNSNPATIMTDDDVADVVYMEPLTVPILERIIAKERPDGILPTLGGQTGLNAAVALDDAGVLQKFGVKVLGTPLSAVRAAEDRGKFKELLQSIGEPVPESLTVTTVADAREFAKKTGLPLVVRPAFTLGGSGGGFCETEEHFAATVGAGLAASPIGQVLVEKSLAGWRELEYEVIRDGAGNCITVCNMENIDPMGVHTGDSAVVAPAQTLTDREHQQLRSSAIRIINALQIEGGCNVQFALAPDSHEYFVIEVNPRVSRSSALASKATGYPIARIAAKIAAGRRLDEIRNNVTGKTCAAMEPALDYCVVKIPRWPFDKFANADRRLNTQMKSTGEVMAIERSFEAAFVKALRSLEQRPRPLTELRDPVLLQHPNDLRLFAVLEALRGGATVDEIAATTGIGRWFIDRFQAIVLLEERLKWQEIDDELLTLAKRFACSNPHIARLASREMAEIDELCVKAGLKPTYKCVDTCAAEFEAVTPYYYSTFETENEVEALAGRSAVVVGSGPIRIGQGIEFDYCSVKASQALQFSGFSSIMINSNPETVSTDFDCSTRLYFEPLDVESVCNVLRAEHPEGAVVQFGGQTAINLASPLQSRGFQLLGTAVDAIDMAEDRNQFSRLCESLGILQPPGGATLDREEAEKIADEIGYPVLVRPSFVLGGRAMEIVHTKEQLHRYVGAALNALPDEGGRRRGTILIDKYLFGTEVDVDAVSDGATVVIPGLMEHVERAGVHSGDSMAAYPPQRLSAELKSEIAAITVKLVRALKVKGLCNIQFVIWRGRPHVLEVNPRASRTVPFISKCTAVPMVEMATRAMLGESLQAMGYETGLLPEAGFVAVKAPVFSNSKLNLVDTALGPEMKSTGEVIGMDYELGAALEKSFTAALGTLPEKGGILCSIADPDKALAIPIIAQFRALGFQIYATSGTASALAAVGITAQAVYRIGQGRPNVLDVIEDGHVSLVINTVSHFDTDEMDFDVDAESAAAAGRTVKDGYRIRVAADRNRIPCCTSIDTASALANAITRQRNGEDVSVASVAEYRAHKLAEPVK